MKIIYYVLYLVVHIIMIFCQGVDAWKGFWESLMEIKLKGSKTFRFCAFFVLW